MNYRDYVLLDREAANSGTTRTLDLKGLDPISELTVSFRITNQSSVPTGHPAFALKTIQVVDGSQVIANLSGEEATALDYWHNGIAPQHILDYTTGDVCEAVVHLPFGRYLWDPDLGLDPTKFSNPQLKVTHDLTLGGSGTPTAAVLSVHLKLFDGKTPALSGYLMNKEFNSYSLVSSAIQTIEMPNDYPLRILMLLSRAAGKNPYDQYNFIKLSENNDKKIPFNMRTEDLMKNLNPHYHRIAEYLTGTATTSSVNHYITPTYQVAISPDNVAAPGGAWVAGAGTGGLTSISAGSAGIFQATVIGSNPMGSVAIPMGDLMNEADWYDLHAISDLKLILTAGSSVLANSTCQTILQQLVKY